MNIRQALDPLVPVSYGCHHPSTDSSQYSSAQLRRLDAIIAALEQQHELLKLILQQLESDSEPPPLSGRQLINEMFGFNPSGAQECEGAEPEDAPPSEPPESV